MIIKKIIGIVVTLVVCGVAIGCGHALWVHYMDAPWTRDARVRADIIDIAPDVSGRVVEMPVRDNQLVHKGDLLMRIDPARYQIIVAQAAALLAARKADLQMRRANAARRDDLDSLVVSRESRDDANSAAAGALAAYQQAQAQLEAAQLDLARTQVSAPVDGYVTNLQTHLGDYASAGVARLALVDRNSFWVYGYFEETKLPRVHAGDAADIDLLDGSVLRGHVDSIARGIDDRDNPQGRALLADVNPTFNWVRLAQRVPVRIAIDAVPAGVVLAAGTTCTVVIRQSHAANRGVDEARANRRAGPAGAAGSL